MATCRRDCRNQSDHGHEVPSSELVSCVHTACAYHALLQQVFQSVVISKLTYAAPAWWGFSWKLYRLPWAFRRLLIASASRHSYVELLDLASTATTASAEELVDDADERLFSKVRHCAHHVLEELLPPTSNSQHNLRKRNGAIT